MCEEVLAGTAKEDNENVKESERETDRDRDNDSDREDTQTETEKETEKKNCYLLCLIAFLSQRRTQRSKHTCIRRKNRGEVLSFVTGGMARRMPKMIAATKYPLKGAYNQRERTQTNVLKHRRLLLLCVSFVVTGWNGLRGRISEKIDCHRSEICQSGIGRRGIGAEVLDNEWLT